VSLSQLWSVVWRSRWLIIGLAVLTTGIGAAYAFLSQEWFRAQVTLAPNLSNDDSGLLDQFGALGGLAGLAGVDLGGSKKSEPLAVLKSRDLAAAFIEEQKLLPTLLSDRWDAAAKAWKTSTLRPEPDLRDGVKLFTEEVRSVQEDRKTGLVTLSMEWTDAANARAWAVRFVDLANERMRNIALTEAQRNVDFLRAQLASANLVAQQQSVGRLLERELQKLMLARGRADFAFRVVDTAYVPRERSWPKRIPIVVTSTLLGFGLGVMIAFIRNWSRTSSRTAG
jgi:uncharacterized protein involved in exopolysaccharide biosynthesis